MIPNSVVFPEPDGPITAAISPSGTSRSAPRRAHTDASPTLKRRTTPLRLINLPPAARSRPAPFLHAPERANPTWKLPGPTSAAAGDPRDLGLPARRRWMSALGRFGHRG